MTRTITVFSTKLGKKTKVETNVTTWGELKDLLIRKEMFNASSMKAIEKASKHSFEANEALLPTGDFTTILLPTKNDSGVDISEDDFNEFVENIMELIEDMKEKINDHADDVVDGGELRNDAEDLEDSLRRQGLIR